MWRPGYEFDAMLVTFVCILYFASHICINPTRDTFLISRGEKKLTKSGYTSSVIPSGKIKFFFDKFMFSENGKVSPEMSLTVVILPV